MPSLRPTWIGGVWATGLGTLASRVLGLVRDMATASLLGLGETRVMDALAIAVRIPNLFRRVLGEGAMTASFVPRFAAVRAADMETGWKLLSTVGVWLAAVLLAITTVMELFLALAWWWLRHDAGWSLLLQLVIGCLPYIITICIASLAGAALQAVGKFSVAALAPTMLNVCWIIGAWWLAPAISHNPITQAWVLVACLQVAGVLQIAVQWPALRQAGFRFDYDWVATGAEVRRIFAAVATVSLGLAVTQINTLFDSVLAWTLAAPPPSTNGAASGIAWLGGMAHPLQTGAAAAIHFGERFYQLPLGLIGFAVATAVFPLLSRHAARGDDRSLGHDLSLAARITLFASVPAAVGLVMLAHPIARVVYQQGAFTAEDTARTARMIATYCLGVPWFCLLPVLSRGFFALGDPRTPVRVGVAAMVFNLLGDVVLIWPLAEVGLAVSTVLAAAVQAMVLAYLLQRQTTFAIDRDFVSGVFKSLVACGAMAAVVWSMEHFWPTGDLSRAWAAAALAGQAVVGMAVYLIAAWFLRCAELGFLLHRSREHR
jgi:putative peptidoglycan lipid II flippase